MDTAILHRACKQSEDAIPVEYDSDLYKLYNIKHLSFIRRIIPLDSYPSITYKHRSYDNYITAFSVGIKTALK